MRTTLNARTALLLLCLAAGGCNAVGAIAYKAVGDPKNPAEFKPAQKPTLILVENFQNPDLYHAPSLQVARDVEQELSENKVAPVVSREKLDDLRTNDAAAYHKMNIPAVGRAAGAKQVIYVNLVKFSAEPPLGGSEMSGLAEARVKVIDAESGRTLWPPDSSEGREVRYETRHEEAVDFSSRPAVQEQISHGIATKIARLFYAAAEPENEVSPK